MSGAGTRSSTTGRRPAATFGSGSAAPRTAASSPNGWPPASARPSAALTGSAGELLARCRAERIEPPSAGRCDRIIRSALHHAEQALTLRVTARLGPDASARLAELAAAAGNDEADDGEPQALSLIKSVPGNVSLDPCSPRSPSWTRCARPGCRTRKASSQRPQAAGHPTEDRGPVRRWPGRYSRTPVRVRQGRSASRSRSDARSAAILRSLPSRSSRWVTGDQPRPSASVSQNAIS